MIMCRLFNVFLLVMEYIRGSGAPECIFQNLNKTLYNLFSPDQAVSCVADKQVSHHEIYTLRNLFSAFDLGVCHYFSSHGYVNIGQMDFISSVFVRC